MSSRTGLNFSQDAYYLSGTAYVTSGLMGSHAAVTAPGEITLTTAQATDPLCAEGDTGVYAYVLSPGATRVTMTATRTTAARARVAVSGDWFRVACKITDGGCWGELEAGTYPSQYVAPRLDPGEAWSVPFGEFTYTVPDGWANSEDWPEPSRSRRPRTMPSETDTDGRHPESTTASTCTPSQRRRTSWTPAPMSNEPTSLVRPTDSPSSSGPCPRSTRRRRSPITIDGHSGVWLDVRCRPGLDQDLPRTQACRRRSS